MKISKKAIKKFIQEMDIQGLEEAYRRSEKIFNIRDWNFFIYQIQMKQLNNVMKAIDVEVAFHTKQYEEYIKQPKDVQVEPTSQYMRGFVNGLKQIKTIVRAMIMEKLD